MNKKNVKYRTDFLLPRNNFWIGMGSVLNLAGSYFDYNYSKSDLDADRKALISDWLNVGDDMKKAKEKFERKYSKNLRLK